MTTLATVDYEQGLRQTADLLVVAGAGRDDELAGAHGVDYETGDTRGLGAAAGRAGERPVDEGGVDGSGAVGECGRSVAVGVGDACSGRRLR
jgi:hypothetical protein